MHTSRSPNVSLYKSSKAATTVVTVAAVLSLPAQAQPIGGDGVAAGSAVAAIVKVPKPWYAPRFVVVSKMRDTIPLYQSLPGLAFKAFSFAQSDGYYGGIYLWKDLVSARAWFTPAWFARVEKERGAPAEVRFFEVLAAIDNTPGGTPVDADSSALVTVSTSPGLAGADKASVARRFQPALDTDRQIPGLLRRYFVVTDQGRFGHISIWRDSAIARQWFNDARSGTVRSSVADAAVEWFDTPILLPSSLPENQPRIPGL